MARPLPEPHPLALKLRGRLSASTLAAYSRIWRRIDASGLSATEWFEAQLAQSAKRAEGEKKHAMAVRTATVFRAAAEWYISGVEQGDPAKLVKVAEIHGLVREKNREALSEDVLDTWNRAAREEMEPYRTILLLLPLTGLRIHEMCDLSPGGIDPWPLRDATSVRFVVMGKGNRERKVPVPGKPLGILRAYLEQYEPRAVWINEDTFADRVFYLTCFEDGEARPEIKACTPRDVWRAVSRLRAAHPELASVVIHQTRHTTATRLLRNGANLKQIQDILGHESIRTVERYLSPTEEELRKQMEKL